MDFRKALNSGDAETVSDVTALIHHLGEHGFDTCGELLPTSGPGSSDETSPTATESTAVPDS
jgi:hypothetical protein